MLRRDRDQLWAEAVVRYDKGEKWWLTSKLLVDAAADEQEDRYQADPWEPGIETWLLSRMETTTADVLKDCIKKEMGQWTRSDETRVGIILSRLGWEPGPRGPRSAGRRRIYRPKDEYREKAAFQ
jgi:putative DNA primase/helicase